jgi:hypothetical protein
LVFTLNGFSPNVKGKNTLICEKMSYNVTDMAKFFYTYRREQAELGDTDGHLVTIDTERSRPNLIELIQDGIRPGANDVICILDDSDIPLGSPLREAIAQNGATIEVIGLERRPPGRPPAFAPDDDLTAIKAIWNTPYYQAEAVRRIHKVLGRKVSLKTLKRHLGERDFKRNA